MLDIDRVSQVPSVVKMVKERLDEGYCVVIGLQSTGEAALRAEGLAIGDTTDLISTSRSILLNFINKHFPTMNHHTTVDSGDENPGTHLNR